MEKASSRLKVVALLVAFMFAALSTRLWFLQVLADAQNRRAALDNSVQVAETDALRGTIKDAKGRELVENRMSLEVRVRKDQLGPNAEQVLLDLADLLDVPVKSITQSLQDKRYYDYQPKPVAEFVPERVAYYLREHPDEFPGVSVVPTSVRAYPWAREHRDPSSPPTYSATSARSKARSTRIRSSTTGSPSTGRTTSSVAAASSRCTRSTSAVRRARRSTS